MRDNVSVDRLSLGRIKMGHTVLHLLISIRQYYTFLIKFKGQSGTMCPRLVPFQPHFIKILIRGFSYFPQKKPNGKFS